MVDLGRIRHVALDMDGTIYLGKTVVSSNATVLGKLCPTRITHSFLTNNCSHSRAEYVRRLQQIGIAAQLDSIQSSAQATAHYIATSLPQVQSAVRARNHRPAR